MFQITLPDTENNRKLVEYLRTIDHAEVVESDDSLPLPSVDQRVKRALECLKREGLIQKKYDYVWIMEYVNEGLLPGNPLWFDSVQSFRDYLVDDLGIEGVAGISTLSQYRSTKSGHHPDWRFSDTSDSHVRIHRVNIAGRFAAAYTKESRTR